MSHPSQKISESIPDRKIASASCPKGSRRERGARGRAASECSLTQRILRRCAELADITDEPGRITRTYLSAAMERANSRVAAWMQEAGLHTELDAAGNLIGVYSGGREDAPVLVLGSHLDTVRDAGAYDGVLGVLLALAVVEKLAGARLPFDLEIVAFADEEGVRYGVPFLGSHALIGELDGEFLERRDGDGIPLAEAIRSWGGEPEQIRYRYEDRRLLGYLEAHIEQGTSLEHQDLPLGILEALSSSCWMRLRFEGRAGHAGTTPMALRNDPMPAAAEVVLAAERLARQERDLVATVGQLRPAPGAGNVIPGSVEMSLDIRHPDSRQLAACVRRILAFAGDIASRRGLGLTYEELNRQAGVEADPDLSRLLGDAVDTVGARAGSLVLGAGHDALIMSRVMPVTMLLLRSPGGISHHPEESVLPGDVEDAVAVLHAFVHQLAEREARDDQAPAWKLAPAKGPVSEGSTAEAPGRAPDTTVWDLEG